MVKMRKAITLFITLAIIVAMLALVGVTFGYLAQARSQAQDKAALIEGNLIYADASRAVGKFVGKKPSVETLKRIYDTPMAVSESKGPFKLMVACAPARAAIPIAWLATNGGAKDEPKLNIANMVFDEIALKNRFQDESLLKSMIAEALNSKFAYNFGIEARLKRDKNHFTWRDFKKVLDSYALKSNDFKVYSANWKSYFSFNLNYKEIDGNFLSSKLISTIFNIDENIVNEDFKSGELKKFLIENGLDVELYNSKLFAKEAVVALTCSVNYTFGKGSYSFKFNYIDGKIEGFENVN